VSGDVVPPPPIPVQDPTLAPLYANLELPYGADVNAVREARRRLLRRYHPDLHSDDPDTRRTATQVAQGLNHAHDELVRRLSRKQQ
jgi:curved DNA-binding protein CbpA